MQVFTAVDGAAFGYCTKFYTKLLARYLPACQHATVGLRLLLCARKQAQQYL